MRFSSQEENTIRLYFRASVLLKGAISAAEVIGGILAFFVPLTFFAAPFVNWAQGELIEEPGDFIATHLIQLAHQFAIASGVFIAIYLLSRGLIKLFLIIALLKNKLWAYPISLVILGLFVLYQVYQIMIAHSAFIMALTVFDLIVMWSIWKEYQVIRSHLATRTI